MMASLSRLQWSYTIFDSVMLCPRVYAGVIMVMFSREFIANSLSVINHSKLLAVHPHCMPQHKLGYLQEA
jgi:hypothetical protein